MYLQLLMLYGCLWLMPSNPLLSLHSNLVHSAMLLTREDCSDLYSLHSAHDSNNALDIIRRMTSHGLDADTIVRLYDYCLRSEEGIRYRRTSGTAILPVKPSHEQHHLGQSQPSKSSKPGVWVLSPSPFEGVVNQDNSQQLTNPTSAISN